MFFYRKKVRNVQRNQKNKKIIPLQVHQHNIKKRDKRTSLSASQRGSITVEAAVVLPVLLCALIGILFLAKVLVVNQEMETALLETARQVARKEALFSEKEREGTGISFAGSLFQKNRKQGDVSRGLTVTGVSFFGSEYRKESKEIKLYLTYKIKVPMLLLGNRQIRIRTGICQKAWNGYAPASGEENSQNQEYLYVTTDGEVYHKDGQCYHLHINIRETKEVDVYYNGQTSYRPCRYCIRKGEGRASALYIPSEGDCYHSDPSCSGLTRTVRYVKKEEAEGMRPCSHCCR